MEIFGKVSDGKGEGGKRFVSTDDWSPMSAPEGSDIDIYRIHLGQLGRWDEGEESVEICRVIEEVIPQLEQLLSDEKVKPMEWEIIGTGYESVADAVKTFDSGKVGGKKALVKIA